MGKKTYKNIRGVLHDGIGYFFPEPQDVTVDIGNKRGNWKRINGQYSSEAVQKETFTIFLSHEQKNDYVYAVSPIDIYERVQIPAKTLAI